MAYGGTANSCCSRVNTRRFPPGILVRPLRSSVSRYLLDDGTAGRLLLIAGAIGWSRIYLNVHHLSDVTVGAFIGIVTAYLLWECGAAWIDRNFVIFFVPRTTDDKAAYRPP